MIAQDEVWVNVMVYLFHKDIVPPLNGEATRKGQGGDIPIHHFIPVILPRHPATPRRILLESKLISTNQIP